MVTSSHSSGFRVGGDYRFYLKRKTSIWHHAGVRSKYFTYHTFSNDHNIEVNNNGTPENGSIAMDLNVGNIGVQLGYSLLNNRWTIDLVFIGPRFPTMKLKSELMEILQLFRMRLPAAN